MTHPINHLDTISFSLSFPTPIDNHISERTLCRLAADGRRRFSIVAAAGRTVWRMVHGVPAGARASVNVVLVQLFADVVARMVGMHFDRFQLTVAGDRGGAAKDQQADGREHE